MRRITSIVLWLAPLLVVIAAGLWTAWHNMGRMANIDTTFPEVRDTVSRYASEGTGKHFDCRVTPQKGYPDVRIHTLSDLVTGNHQVMGYDWICKSGDETVTGIFAIFADDQWVWQGVSSTRGDLSTHEM